MAEPDNIMLEHLRAIRADLSEVKQRLTSVETKLDGKSDAAAVELLELKLDGLTHAVIAGFGSVVHELDAIKVRVERLEGERV